MARSSESSIVTKCALVMDILSSARTPLTFSDIVEQTGFVKSSCHRILAVLAGERMIQYDKSTRKYQTGERLNEWSRSAWRRVDLQEIASTEMRKLSDEFSVNVALSRLDAETILYLRTVDHMPIRYAAAMGDHAPLHSTAAGKVFLAHMTPSNRHRIFEKMAFEKMTEYTKTHANVLLEDLQAVPDQGYAVALQEEFLNVFGVAAPIWNEDGSIAACLSIWMTSVDPNAPSRIVEFAAPLMSATHRISNALGWVAVVEGLDDTGASSSI